MLFRWLRGVRKPRPVYRVVLQPSGRELQVRADQSVLEAALAAGLPFPHNCRAGICHSCRCRLLEGEVYVRRDKSRFARPLDPAEPQMILACQSEPRSVLEIEVEARGNRPIT